MGKCFRQHRSVESPKFLKLIDERVEPGLEVHLITDNYSTARSN